MWWNCAQSGINKYKITNGKRGQQTELTGRCQSRWRRSALECSAI